MGGGEVNDLNAAHYLRQRGHDVTIVTASPMVGKARNLFDMYVVYLKTPWLYEYPYWLDKINIKLAAALRHLDLYLFEWAVLRWLRRHREKFDIVQMCSLFHLLPGKLLTEFCWPCVSWLPGHPSGLTRRKIRSFVQYQNFAMFTHGEPENSLLDMGFEKGREYEVIEAGIELDVIDQVTVQSRAEERAESGFHESDLLGVTVARLIPIKNHAMLLEAIALSREKGVIWNWIFAGGGHLLNHLKQRTLALGIENQVHWSGNIGRVDVYRLLRMADLFALTSIYENFSIAILEAMAHRLPIIGTRVGYLQRLIDDSGAGIVVPSGDARILADTLVKMADLEIRNLYRGQGRTFVEQLNWPKIAEKLEELYLKLQKL